MSRARNPNRDKAFEIYKKENGNIKPGEIAKILNESASNIRSWKNKDKWAEKLPTNKGGAPKGNLNRLQHGDYYNPTKHLKKDFLNKYLPAATQKIMKEISENGISTLDMLWTNIQMQFTAIMRSQAIMHVESKDEMIKELKKTKVQNEVKTNKNTGKKEVTEIYREEEFEFQFAWDRQATFLNAQSKAIATLQSSINQYEALLHKNWDNVTEEEKLRLEKMKLDIAAVNKETLDNELKIVIDYGDSDGNS